MGKDRLFLWLMILLSLFTPVMLVLGLFLRWY